eukprot:TRINITY_DN5150_c0_g1_i3.p1 TRINITY_DN5150_c0_g1~~TRINITY_DN5150_c0_g1_i3.p1  ORF type:complete len:154 (+),score=27.29 TRINITY_DN5150_c0_g1_i3:359-820(+)
MPAASWQSANSSNRLHGDEKKRSLEIYRTIDRDEDGIIDAAELLHALGQSGSQLMNSLDLDASAQVSYDEWTDYLNQVKKNHGAAVLGLFLTDCERSTGVSGPAVPSQASAPGDVSELIAMVRQLDARVAKLQSDVGSLLQAAHFQPNLGTDQ